MFNNEQDFEEWRVDCLNKAKEILTMDKEKENNRSKKIETTGECEKKSVKNNPSMIEYK